MSIQLPAGLKCDPVHMAEGIQQENVLVGGGWLYPRVNVANTVHLSKHHSYCLQSHNRGRKVELEEFKLSAAQKPILVQTHLHLAMCSPQTLSLSLPSPPLPDVVLHLKGIHLHMLFHVISHACICSPPTMVLPYPASRLSADLKRH